MGRIEQPRVQEPPQQRNSGTTPSTISSETLLRAWKVRHVLPARGCLSPAFQPPLQAATNQKLPTNLTIERCSRQPHGTPAAGQPAPPPAAAGWRHRRCHTARAVALCRWKSAARTLRTLRCCWRPSSASSSAAGGHGECNTTIGCAALNGPAALAWQPFKQHVHWVLCYIPPSLPCSAHAAREHACQHGSGQAASGASTPSSRCLQMSRLAAAAQLASMQQQLGWCGRRATGAQRSLPAFCRASASTT